MAQISPAFTSSERPILSHKSLGMVNFIRSEVKIMRFKALTSLIVSLNLLVIGVFFLSSVAAEDAPYITKEELKAILGNPDVVVIDVRHTERLQDSDFMVKGHAGRSRHWCDNGDQWSLGLRRYSNHIRLTKHYEKSFTGDVETRRFREKYRKNVNKRFYLTILLIEAPRLCASCKFLQ